MWSHDGVFDLQLGFEIRAVVSSFHVQSACEIMRKYERHIYFTLATNQGAMFRYTHFPLISRGIILRMTWEKWVLKTVQIGTEWCEEQCGIFQRSKIIAISSSFLPVNELYWAHFHIQYWHKILAACQIARANSGAETNCFREWLAIIL